MPPSPKLNLLVAYPYVTKKILAGVAEMGDECRWLLDSGAFTAWKAGKPIHLDDYCRFIDTLPVKPWRYFALDVIGDPEATARNYQAMLDRGHSPIPVFTRGETLNALDRLFETSDVVALGGVAGADKSAYSWVKRVMQHVGNRHVHILGFTAMDWVKFLRPYSVDSSSWRSGARYGNIYVYVGQGRFIQFTRRDLGRGQPTSAVSAAICALGFDPNALRRDDAWTGMHGLVEWLNAASWVKASLEVEHQLGTMLFLAMPADRLLILRQVLRAVQGKLDGEAARQLALSQRRTA